MAVLKYFFPALRHSISAISARGAWSAQRRRFSSEKSTTDKEDDYEDSIRENILNASLPFVNQHGWSQEAVAEGAKRLGYAGVASGLFQNAASDLIFFFYVKCNNELVSKLKCDEETRNNDRIKVEPHIIVERAIETRLRMVVPYLERWPQALGIMTMPRNVPIALSNLLTLVDDICFYAGDRSVDFNWYSRRLAIAGIYKMTELCLVQDRSSDKEETWKFLNRRIEEAVSIHNLMQSTEGATTIARETILATFTTARNILRLNGMR